MSDNTSKSKIEDYVKKQGWFSLGLAMHDNETFMLYIMTDIGEVSEMAVVIDKEITQYTAYYGENLPTEVMLYDIQHFHPIISKFLTDDMLATIRTEMKVIPFKIIQREFPIYEYLVFYESPISGNGFVHIRESYFRGKNVN